MLKLTEGEKLALVVALSVAMITTPRSRQRGSNIRLMKKIWRNVILEAKSYGKIKISTF